MQGQQSRPSPHQAAGMTQATGTREKILIVEDNPDTMLALTQTFEDQGFQVEGHREAEGALRGVYSFQPDIAVLDILLPGMNGIDLCERIRGLSDMPVIMLSAVSSQEEKLMAFDKGADDYVVKTTPTDELIARVNAALRRAHIAGRGVEEPGSYADDAIKIDFRVQTVIVNGRRVDLTPTEFSMLALLVKNAGRPLNTKEILDTLWTPEHGSNMVKVYIRRLREAIEDNPSDPRLIVTRRGFGYAYTPAGTNAA